MNKDNIIYQRPNKIIYRENDKVIKVFASEFSKADVMNEALNLARAEQTGLNVPVLHGVMQVEGSWALVYDYIEGKTLSKLITEDPENANKYIDIMVQVQMDVHKKKNALLVDMKQKLARKISQSGLDAATRYSLRSALEAMPLHDKVCHGDMRLSNVIISPDGTPFIIDWSHLTQGNASSDVATSYLIFLLGKNGELAKYYLEKYCEMSGTPAQYIRKWVPIVAAAQCARARGEEYKTFAAIAKENA